jgi:hypothetical protein
MLVFNDFLYFLENPSNIVKYTIKSPNSPKFLKAGKTPGLGKCMKIGKSGKSIYVITESKFLCILNSENMEVIKNFKYYESLFLTNNFDVSDNEKFLFANQKSPNFEITKFNFYKNKKECFLKNKITKKNSSEVVYSSKRSLTRNDTYVISSFSNLRRLVYSSNTSNLNLFNTINKKRLSKNTNLFSKYLTVCGQLGKSGLILIGGWDTHFYLFDISGWSFKVINKVKVENQIYCTSVSPKGSYFACSGDNEQAIVFKINYNKKKTIKK